MRLLAYNYNFHKQLSKLMISMNFQHKLMKESKNANHNGKLKLMPMKRKKKKKDWLLNKQDKRLKEKKRKD